MIMHDDPQVLLNQLFTGITFLCGSVRLNQRSSLRTARLPGAARGGPDPGRCLWPGPTPHPVGSVLTFVVDGERYPETLSTEGSLVRRFEVRRWLNLEFRSAAGDLAALTNPGYAW